MTLDRYLTKHKIASIKFATMMGVSPGAVSRWRQRTRIPRVKALKKIAFLTRRKVTSLDWYNGE